MTGPRTICEACERDDHVFCADIPDEEREMVFRACRCLHNTTLVQRDAQVTALLVIAQTAFGRGDDQATATALRRALAVLEPPRGIRKLALVGYAQASGEPIEPWMRTARDGERK